MKGQKNNSPKIWAASSCVPELATNAVPSVKICKQILNRLELRRTQGIQELYTLEMHYQTFIVSNSSGVVDTTISDDVTNTAEWSTYSLGWDEYRVIGMEVNFRPNKVVGGSTAFVRTAIVSATDYDDATAFNAYTVADRYSDAKYHEPGVPWKHISCESDIDQAIFLNITSTSPSCWVKLYSSGNTVSSTIGSILVRYIIQFRGRGL